MSITPVELRNFHFAQKFRGYERQEVDSLVEQAAQEIEKLIAAKMELEEEIRKLREKLQYYERIEGSLSDALVTAEKAAEEVKQAAHQSAQLQLRGAELESQAIKARTHEEVEKARQDLETLKKQKIEFVIELRALINSHLQFLTHHSEVQAAKESAERVSEVYLGVEENKESEYEPFRTDQ